MDIVPAMAETLLSVGKFSDAGYVTIFDNQLVKIYDGNNCVSEDAVIRGWQDSASGLYQILLKIKVENWKIEAILLDEKKQKNRS